MYGAGCAAPSPWGLEKPVSQALARPPGEMKFGGTPPSATETALARGVDAGLSSVKLTDALLVITCPFTLLASLVGTKTLLSLSQLLRLWRTGGGERSMLPLDCGGCWFPGLVGPVAASSPGGAAVPLCRLLRRA